MLSERTVIAVIGLGYVGLPLAVEFGKKFKTIGVDLSQHKIDSYRGCIDPSGELATTDLRAAVREAVLSPRPIPAASPALTF